MSAPAGSVPVLRIEIDDSAVKAFQANFAKFQEEAKKLPDGWADVDKQVERVQDRFEKMRKAAADQEESVGGAADAAEKTRKSTDIAAVAWTGMYGVSRRVTAGVRGATVDLAKWSRLTAVFTGLIGAGGLFGLNTLAAASAMRRREAGGAGVSIGEQSAFQTNFGRLGDTGGLLHGFNEAATDISKQQPLVSLGIDPKNKDAAQLFVEALPKIKAIVDAADPSNLHGALEPYNLGQLGVDDAMARRIRGMSTEELDALRANFRRDTRAMDVPDDVARRWQDFTTGLSRAETSIQTALATNLVNLTPGLENLSRSVVHLLNVIIDDGSRSKGWLDRLGTGITHFADVLGSEDVTAEVDAFMKKVDASKQDFDAINQWFGSHQDLLKFLAAEYAGWRVAGPLGVAGVALGAAIMPTEANGGEDEIARRRRFGIPDYAPGRGPSSPGSPGVVSSGQATIPAEKTNEIVGGANAAHPDAYWGDPSSPSFEQEHLVTIKTPSGKSVIVNKQAAGAYSGFLADLEKSGYKIDTLGGYSHRANVNNPGRMSMHAFGDAIDINSDDNPNARPGSPNYGRTNLPSNVSEMAARHGLSWGGDWNSVKDTMHFEFAGPKADALFKTDQSVPTDAHAPIRSEVGGEQKKPAGSPLPRSLQHPNSRPAAPQTVHVIDNTGGASTVQVAH